MVKKIPVYDIQNFTSYKNDGILVHRFGPYARQNMHLHQPHKHSFYHLVFFTSVKGKQQIDFETFDLQNNQIYFMSPGQVHHWQFDTDEPEGYLINFSTSYFSNFLLKQDYLDKFSFFTGNPAKQVINLTNVVAAKLTTIFDEILSEGENNTLVNDDLVRLLLLQIFVEVNRCTTTNTAPNENHYNHTILNNFKHLIEENYKTLRLPKQYAAQLYITPNHLNALCNDFLGMPAGKLIRDRVVLEAKRLLINVDLLVSEIADILNFEDQSYFVKFFKKHEGVTPDKFRKQYLTHQNGIK